MSSLMYVDSNLNFERGIEELNGNVTSSPASSLLETSSPEHDYYAQNFGHPMDDSLSPPTFEELCFYNGRGVLMDSNADPQMNLFQELNNYSVDALDPASERPNNSNHQVHKRGSNGSGDGDNIPVTPEIEIILYHKPRGCKGIWKQVEKHNAIRVTKGKGKWLKLDIRSVHPFHANNVDVFLVDISSASSPQDIIKNKLVHNDEEGISIETTQEGVTENPGIHLVEVELKLDRVCKRLQFWAVLKMKDGKVLIGRSAEFAAHNNGKTKMDHEVSSPISSDESISSPSEAITLTEMPSTISKTSLATQQHHHHSDSSPERSEISVPPKAQIQKTRSHSGEKKLNIQQINNNSTPNGHASNGNGSKNPSNQLSQLLANFAANPMNVPNSTAINSLMATVNGPSYNFPPNNANFNANFGESAANSTFNPDYSEHHQGFEIYNGDFEMGDIKPNPFLSNGNSQPVRPNPNKRSRISPDHHNNVSNSTHDNHSPSYNNHTNNNGNNHHFEFGANNNNNNSSPIHVSIPTSHPPQHQPEITTNIPGSMTVNGVVKAHAFIQFSDLRLKANLQELTDAVNIISQLEGKSYTWKNDVGIGHEVGGRRVIGLIAQQVQKIVPEIVYEDKESGLLSVSYAEIVPILIEAFKQQSTENQAIQEGVQKELNDLRSKLEEIDKTIYYDSPEPKSIYGKIGRRISRALEPSTPFKKYFFRGISVFAFLVGLFLLVFGSISLGMALYGADAVVHTEVVSASGLKQMDRFGYSDPFVELDFGSEIQVTQTRWNTSDPVWGQTFKIPLDPATVDLSYVVYDADENPDFGPRRMGVVVIPVRNVSSGLVDAIYQLQPSSSGDTTSGTLRLTILITYKKSPDYEIVMIVIGIILIVLSLVFGTFLWRKPRTSLYVKRRPLISTYRV